MIFFPNAKINIGLNILSKRIDGYHNLETIFYPIKLYDALEIIPSNNLSFNSSGINVPNKNNLCVLAYELMKNHYDISPVSIHLHKNIPIGAGLGGGSSNAAFTLLAINDIFKLNLNKNTLKKIAFELGADCPFFIENIPSLANGIGEVLKPIHVNLEKYHLLVVTPNIFISTKEAFKDIQCKIPSQSLSMSILQNINDWTIKNDFESSIFKLHPKIQSIKDKLIESGAIYSSLSGTGSSVYGIFSKKTQIDFTDMFTFYQPLEFQF